MGIWPLQSQVKSSIDYDYGRKGVLRCRGCGNECKQMAQRPWLSARAEVEVGRVEVS